MTSTPTSRRAWTAVAAGVAANVVPVAGMLLLGWPGGNLVVMFVADTVLMALIAWAAVRRAVRVGQAGGLPPAGRPWHVAGWALLLGVVALVMALVARSAGLEAGALALGIPLAAAVTRAGSDALGVLGRPEDQAGDAARQILLATLLRVGVMVATTWVLFEFRPSGAEAIALLGLVTLLGVKTLVDARMSYLAAGGATPRR